MRKIFFFILIICFIFSLVFLAPRFIKIREISCRSQFGPCSDYLSELIARVEDKSLNEVKRDLKKILGDETQVIDFSLRFNLPNKLHVYLIKRKAMVAIRRESLVGFALIDKEGRVIGIEEKTLLPILVVEEESNNLEVGKEVSERVRFGGELLNRMSNFYGAKQALIKDGSFEIKLSQGVQVLFPLEGEIDVLLGSLKLILSRLNSEAQDFKIEGEQIYPRLIDLRFKNPIIR